MKFDILAFAHRYRCLASLRLLRYDGPEHCRLEDAPPHMEDRLRRATRHHHACRCSRLVKSWLTRLLRLPDFDIGRAAYVRGDYATAAKTWHPLAERGHADAQYNLGGLYASGRGVRRSCIEAQVGITTPLSRAMRKRSTASEIMYEIGVGDLQNDAEAVKWYRKAAKQGNANAQQRLGVCPRIAIIARARLIESDFSII